MKFNPLKYLPACEKLQGTVRLLAVCEGRLKKRLVAAYEDQLIYIEPENMPEHLRDKLIEIQNELTKNHTKPAEEATYYWKKSKCWNVATDIFYLFCQLSYHVHSGGKT